MSLRLDMLQNKICCVSHVMAPASTLGRAHKDGCWGGQAERAGAGDNKHIARQLRR